MGAVTFGIFTPFSTIVTCASSTRIGALPEGSVIQLPEGFTVEQRQAAFNQAAELAISSGSPAYVKF